MGFVAFSSFSGERARDITRQMVELLGLTQSGRGS